MVWYFFGVILAGLACVLCTSEALNTWIEGEDMNWCLLFLGIVNGILFVIDSYHLFNTLTL